MLILVVVLVYFSKQKETFFQTYDYQTDECQMIWNENESTMKTECAATDKCVIVKGWCAETCWDKTEDNCKDGCKWDGNYCQLDTDTVDTNCWNYNTPEICHKQTMCKWNNPSEHQFIRCVTDDSESNGTTASGTTASGSGDSGDSGDSGGSGDSGDSGDGGGWGSDKWCNMMCTLYRKDNTCAKLCPQ